MRWHLSRRAERDVIAIYREGLRTWGMAQADAYHNRLEEVFGLLARFPRLAPERGEIDPPVRVHPHGAHIVVYVVEPDGGVLIVRVRHGREDWIGDPVGDADEG